MDLTKRQQEIFDFIKRYSAKYGYPPTVRDIGKAVGLASSSTVHAHLANLERIGMLRRDPSKPRAIELLDRAAAGMRSLVRPGLPLVGQVAAGQPVLAEENIEDYIQTPAIAGGDEGDYLLRVRGESMKDVGILDGDLVVVYRSARCCTSSRRAGTKSPRFYSADASPLLAMGSAPIIDRGRCCSPWACRPRRPSPRP